MNIASSAEDTKNTNKEEQPILFASIGSLPRPRLGEGGFIRGLSVSLCVFVAMSPNSPAQPNFAVMKKSDHSASFISLNGIHLKTVNSQ